MANIRVKLKKMKRRKRRKREQKNQLSRLRNNPIKNLYSVEVENKNGRLEDEATAEEQRCNFSESLVEAAIEVVPKVERTMRLEWMTKEILRQIER